MTKKLALIGCGNAKNPGVLPAKDKYSSNYFGLKWDYGDGVCDDQLILSAEHRLLEPEKEIGDYDKSIGDLSDSELYAWTKTVNLDLTSRATVYEWDEIHVLLGRKYLEPIEDTLEEIDAEIVRPFEGASGIGEQMSQLKELTQAERASQ